MANIITFITVNVGLIIYNVQDYLIKCLMLTTFFFKHIKRALSKKFQDLVKRTLLHHYFDNFLLKCPIEIQEVHILDIFKCVFTFQ